MFESLLERDVLEVLDVDEVFVVRLYVLLVCLFDFFFLMRDVFMSLIESISLKDVYLVGFFPTTFEAGTLDRTAGELQI